uniref:Uncharacterized protein n=1 Tax=Globisporangium ultimum (strain ATCC 200006 / CBS 805.95 / DAOM BR144) TaxID=431595 RepID=K3WTH2_GLOUD
MVTSQHRYLQIVKFLVAMGADQTCYRERGRDAFCVCSRAGNVATVWYFVKLGLVRKRGTRFLVNALTDAVEGGHAKIVEYIHHVQDISHDDINDSLFSVVQFRRVGVAELLLKNGGTTPFGYGAEHGNLEVVQFMVQHGADVMGSRTFRDEEAIQAIVEAGGTDLLQAMRSLKGDEIDFRLAYTCEARDIEVIKLLVANGAAVNAYWEETCDDIHFRLTPLRCQFYAASLSPDDGDKATIHIR